MSQVVSLLEQRPTQSSSFSGNQQQQKRGGGGGGAATTTTAKRRVVIMDEVDGMGGNDRGGIAELIRIIKMSRSPIVCICNDRQSQKIRSLTSHCFDLRVKRPTKTQIAQRLVQIGLAEDLRVDQNAAEMLVEQSGNDIRQAINAMQMWKYCSDDMSFMDMKSNLGRIEKDKQLRNTPCKILCMPTAVLSVNIYVAVMVFAAHETNRCTIEQWTILTYCR
jgi:replication factor C subunit 1